MLKIFIINPTYQYVYECIVKIVYHSYEDGNKKFNHQPPPSSSSSSSSSSKIKHYLYTILLLRFFDKINDHWIYFIRSKKEKWHKRRHMYILRATFFSLYDITYKLNVSPHFHNNNNNNNNNNIVMQLFLR